MKQFNLEEAKAGKKVQNGKGEEIRILCFNAPGIGGPIVGINLKNNKICRWLINGQYYSNLSNEDLIMAPEYRATYDIIATRTEPCDELSDSCNTTTVYKNVREDKLELLIRILKEQGYNIERITHQAIITF